MHSYILKKHNSFFHTSYHWPVAPFCSFLSHLNNDIFLFPVSLPRWYKDGQEITQENSSNLYEISKSESEGRNGAYTVQSTLKFRGSERKGAALTAGDRGRYSCVYQNEVDKAESVMLLRIEREFSVLLLFSLCFF